MCLFMGVPGDMPQEELNASFNSLSRYFLNASICAISGVGFAFVGASLNNGNANEI